MKNFSYMNVVKTIIVVMISFHELVPKSHGKQYGVLIKNLIGEGIKVLLFFQDVPYRSLHFGGETIYFLNTEVGDGVGRVQCKCSFKWKEPEGKTIVQTFVAFDNDPGAGILDVIYHDDINTMLVAWYLYRQERYLVNQNIQGTLKGSWSNDDIGQLYQVRLANTRKDKEEIEIVSLEDSSRRYDLPSLTSINLEANKAKVIQFNVDRKDIDYWCIVKWKGKDDGREIVRSFSAFKYSAQYKNHIQSCGIPLKGTNISLCLREDGIYMSPRKKAILDWKSIGPPVSSSHSHP